MPRSIGTVNGGYTSAEIYTLKLAAYRFVFGFPQMKLSRQSFASTLQRSPREAIQTILRYDIEERKKLLAEHRAHPSAQHERALSMTEAPIVHDTEAEIARYEALYAKVAEVPLPPAVINYRPEELC